MFLVFLLEVGFSWGSYRSAGARRSSGGITLTSFIDRAAGGRRDLEETRVNEGRERRGRLVLRHGGSLWEHHEQRVRKYQNQQSQC